jgi:hypothetical protein
MPVNFLQTYVSFLKRSEIPEIFSLWTGLSAISAALGRRVWIDQGIYTIFPNIYVLLVAASGVQRKSTAIKVAEKLVRSVDPPMNILSERITPEALIKSIRTYETEDEERLLAENCTGFSFVEELGLFISRHSYDAGLAPLLIKLYDCSDFDYETRARGKEALRNPCLGLLAGTTPKWLLQDCPPAMIGSGLASRIIFVHTNEEREPVPTTILTAEQAQDREAMIRTLQEIAAVSGPVLVDPPVRQYYEESYVRWYKSPDRDSGVDSPLGGFKSRRHVHIYKLSILFSASELSLNGPSLHIKLPHYLAAEATIRNLETVLPQIIDLIASNETGARAHDVMRLISIKKSASKSEILRAFSHTLSSRELGEVLDTLVESGRIVMWSNGRQVGYRLRD